MYGYGCGPIIWLVLLIFIVLILYQDDGRRCHH